MIHYDSDRGQRTLPDVLREDNGLPVLDKEGMPKMAPDVEAIVLQSLRMTVNDYAERFEAITTHDSLKVTVFGQLCEHVLYFNEHQRHGFDQRDEEHIVAILGIIGIYNAMRQQAAA